MHRFNLNTILDSLQLSGGQRFDWTMEDAYQLVRRKDNITTLVSLVFHQIWKFYCKSYFGGTPLHDNNLLSNESIINEYIQHLSVMKLIINNSIMVLDSLSDEHDLVDLGQTVDIPTYRSPITGIARRIDRAYAKSSLLNNSFKVAPNALSDHAILSFNIPTGNSSKLPPTPWGLDRYTAMETVVNPISICGTESNNYFYHLELYIVVGMNINTD
ncbi:hypothetical protein PPL_00515 [Heterostelium album PN500]|uniref:Uncharacterized protein n=1 Tax=Heterostelium pallidum (strain ATCC 26659 / Pp 5 / PN500) TaxID=670386 RepID=D3AWN9_HETP5|nr:hypothetical protein PPL_00515 [Heterostelium album PN500]EFA86712.1 hypothetical protein PPL_00515 [Heterostelium album PN500]|eukprot:XP_020438816.1 hypothetical protein PPL_00515 [Heterostelium album PN500]